MINAAATHHDRHRCAQNADHLTPRPHHRLINLARNLTRSFFEIGHKRCNSNDRMSDPKTQARELRATLLGNHSGMPNRRTHRSGRSRGHGRASKRRAERSSRRGRLAGGPPPTGTHSSSAPQPGLPAPGSPAGHQATSTRTRPQRTRTNTTRARQSRPQTHTTRARQSRPAPSGPGGSGGSAGI